MSGKKIWCLLSQRLQIFLLCSSYSQLITDKQGKGEAGRLNVTQPTVFVSIGLLGIQNLDFPRQECIIYYLGLRDVGFRAE